MDIKDDLYPEEKKELWRLTLQVIKDHFNKRLDENVFEGVRDEKLYHGLKATSQTILQKIYTNICFCYETQEYLMLNKGVEMLRFSMQGKLLEPSFPLSGDPFTHMFWCNGINCLICFEPDSENVRFLSSSCKNIKTLLHEFPVKSIYYNQKSNELIIVDTHHSAKYELHFNEEELEPSAKPIRYNDSQFGVNWQLECSTLITDSSVQLQLAASYTTVLYLLPLEIDEEDEDFDGTVEFLGKLMNASKAPINVIYFHESSSWIIIGDQQGNVTAFTLDLEMAMTHSAIHDAQIAGIISHPSICGFLTYSQNEVSGTHKIQVWSCNFREPIEAFEDSGDIRGITINPLAAAVVILSSKLTFYTMHQVYCFHAALTSPTVSLYDTKTPIYTKKIIAACKDNSVRIFSSSGKQMNIQLLSQESLSVQSSLYAGMKNKLITSITKYGDLLVSDVSVYPIKFKHVIVNDGPTITCFAVFEFYDEIRDQNRRPRNPRLFYPIRSLIMAGTEVGELIVINDETGKYESTYSAHEGSVVQVHVSSLWKQLVSLGKDRCVKVWRIFADLPKALVIKYILYFIIPITQVAFIKDRLCLINSSEHSKIHQVLMENMSQKVRLEHELSKDHTAPILNVRVSEFLELCATSSVDNTIRIWDRDNCLVKILEINTRVRHMCFASARGDIVFSAGRHLYKIPFENYLSPKYRARLEEYKIPKEEDEKSIIDISKIDDSSMDNSKNDQNLRKILYPVSSMPLGCIDITTSSSTRVDVLLLKQMCAIYNYRDQDILKIKDNFVLPKKIVSNKALMTTDVWDTYVAEMLNSMSPPTLATPKYDFQNLLKTKAEERKMYNPPGIFQMLFDYSIDEIENIENICEVIKGSKLPSYGFLPNSVLYQPYQEKPKPKPFMKPKVKRKPVKYQYPAQFYPEERPSQGQISIRLSQLLTQNVENTDGIEKEQ